MMKMRMNKRYASLTIGLGLTVLAGCSQLNQLMGSEEAVNYKSTVAGDPLSIPPDLSQANSGAHYKAPEGSATYSQFAKNQQERRTAGPGENILPQASGIQVMRDGNIRWLVVDQPAEAVYPKVVDFWGEQGFTIRTQNPRAGLMETDWAENRAKIPEGWIKSALGSIMDSVFDSGERERFRARLERVNGKTEIYISHDQMVETGTADNRGWKWVEGKEDPGLNAAMLARLMVFLGTDVQTAQAKIEQAEKAPGVAQVTQAQDGQVALTLAEPFDRAWRRVGVALDSAGFSIDDRDRSTGDYFVRYLDTDTGQKIEQPNFISRMFGGKGTSEAKVYRIHVAQQGQGSVVNVLDQNGQPDTTDTAKRIITVLNGHM
ncbi:Beta-barrel assembly machine subunit BamC OS=Eoetvoesiella caeni OX=645616 GN=DFR37_106227 PE=4 SV=1 [Eoetvoesiella caeni]|uniref:Beta-barrel assembly machine subunit BamC n=2 Tax=Eoetvoesiella caeni TaxID=645616 RepID=A0A366HBR0_9BURK|nr:Beta-barrel assembly machine subunit BamC [Eoetvoesiella caeni]